MTDQNVQPADAALRRLLPRHHSQFALSVSDDAGGPDRFRIGGRAGRIAVEGTSPGTLLAGVRWYLAYSAGVAVSWPGESSSRLPATLPAPVPGERSASVAHRFALNDTDEGYSGPYRDWAARERQIDLLALHGINEVLVTVGAEEVYRRTFTEFGYTDEEIRAWIPAPAHQPWWLLQNMSGFGGPVSAGLFERRTRLAGRIVARLRELGITPVLPGYFGTVPPGFAERNPGAAVLPQGTWCGLTRPDWLDPRDPRFADVAAAYYRHQRDLFGAQTMVKMDPIHEGGDPGDVPLEAAASAIMDALQKASPGATWVLLGWLSNPRSAILDAVDPARLLVVDGLSDRHPDLDREADWAGVPYAFGTVCNFGGHTTIGANTDVWARRFPAWRDKAGSALAGIAWLPEATGTNPAAFELFTELPWHDEPIQPAEWFAAFARRRYGGIDLHAHAAWDILRRTAYGTPADGWSEAQDSPFLARPSLTARNAATWSPPAPRYDTTTFAVAVDELLQVDPALRDTDAYRFDVVDVVRQAVTNQAWRMLPRIAEAYERLDRDLLRELTDRWLRHMERLDDLLATDPRFLLGSWLRAARAAAAPDEAAAAQLEYDARSILTTWGDRSAADGGRLRDYANREWAGLLRDFHAVRWRRFFNELRWSLVAGRPVSDVDWFALEDHWARLRREYPDRPTGDCYDVACAVWAEAGW